MLNNFKKHIDQQLSFLYDCKLIVAISGGLDSVILAHLCNRLNLNFSLAHCNFNLRGEESDKDEDFVLQLAETLEVEVFIQNFDTAAYATEHKRSIQMAARELRYDWLKELAEQLKFDYILTAHHADDNLETFLINFTRGTGLNGLTGIPPINDNIVRPLLQFSRQQIEVFAKANQITWQEDSSNASRKYLRNKLRHEVVPILKTINPQLLDSFQSTLDNLNDTATIVQDSLKAFSKRAIILNDAHHMTFKISEFQKLRNPKAYLFEMFKNYGFTEWNDVVGLLDAQSGKQVRSKTHRLIKDRTQLILTKLNGNSMLSENVGTILIKEPDQTVVTPFGVLSLSEADGSSKASKKTIYVDRNQLQFPLTLRKWQSGDVFYPFGMKGKKKLSKYLKDEKLSLVEKEHVWVLISEDEIVWVVNMRADERFKVQNNTIHILKITLQ